MDPVSEQPSPNPVSATIQKSAKKTIAKVLLIVLGIYIGTSSIGSVAYVFIATMIANDVAPPSGWAYLGIIVMAIWPVVILLIFFLVALYFYRKQKYLLSTGSILTIFLVVLALYMHVSWKQQQLNQLVAMTQLSASSSSPSQVPPTGSSASSASPISLPGYTFPRGFLVPTAASIPNGFTLFLPYFADGVYALQYNERNGTYIVGGLTITEASETPSNNYQEIADPKVQPPRTTKVADFNYEGFPGVVYVYRGSNMGDEYTLLFHDGNHLLRIDAQSGASSTIQFSSDILINILKTLVRQP